MKVGSFCPPYLSSLELPFHHLACPQRHQPMFAKTDRSGHLPLLLAQGDGVGIAPDVDY